MATSLDYLSKNVGKEVLSLALGFLSSAFPSYMLRTSLRVMTQKVEERSLELTCRKTRGGQMGPDAETEKRMVFFYFLFNVLSF